LIFIFVPLSFPIHFLAMPNMFPLFYFHRFDSLTTGWQF
jgi:hypothetical protein